MPSSRPVSATVVLLNEVLEVRGEALEECQIWSLLYQSAEALHDVTLAGEALDDNQPAIYVMPDTVSLSSDGSVHFEQCPRQTFEQSKYCPFEWQAGIADATDTVAIEKMWTYALGMTAYTSADYNLRSDEALRVAEALSSCLSCMVEHQADRRCTLIDVIEACFKHANKHMTQPFCYYTQAMYKSVLGSPPNEVATFSLMDHVSLYQLKKSPLRDNPSGHHSRKREAPGSIMHKLNDLDSDRDWTFLPTKYRSTGLVSREHPESRPVLNRIKVDPASELLAASSSIAAHQRAQSNNSPLWEIFGSLGAPKKPPGDGMSTESFLRAAYERIIDRRQKLLMLSEGLGMSGDSPVVDSRGSEAARLMPTSAPASAAKVATYPITEESASFMSASVYSSTTSLTHGSFYPIGHSSASISLDEAGLLAEGATATANGDEDLTFADKSPEVTPTKHVGSDSRRVADRVVEDLQEERVRQKEVNALEGSRRAEAGPAKPPISDKAVHQSNLAPAAKRQSSGGASSLIVQLPEAATVPLPREPSVVTMQLKKEATVAKNKKPQRAFAGPEPVFNAGQPIREIPFYIPGKQKGKVASVVSSPTLHKSVMVTLLTGERIRLHCTGSSTGGQIFKAVVEEMDMKEQYYFGLTYIKDNEHFFIDEDTKLHKIAPDYWKKDAPSSFDTLSLYVRVKYYTESIQSLSNRNAAFRLASQGRKEPPSPVPADNIEAKHCHRLGYAFSRHHLNSRLLGLSISHGNLARRQPSSRHGLYLQLRTDVVEERLLVESDDALSLLAGVALQAEYGDHADARRSTSYFLPQHYLPAQALRRMREGHWRTTLAACHARNAGLSSAAAESKFVEICQRVQDYGMHFYRVFVTEAQASAFVSTLPIGDGRVTGLIWLGLSARGLVLCETRSPNSASSTSLPWSSLQKFSFNRKKVTIVTQVSIEKPKATKTSYFTDGYRKAKYLVLFASTLQRYRRQTVTLSQGTRVSVTAVGESSATATEMVWSNVTEDHREAYLMEPAVMGGNSVDGVDGYGEASADAAPRRVPAGKASRDTTDELHDSRKKIVTTSLEKDPETGSLGINLVGMNDPEKRGIFVAEVMRRGHFETKGNVRVGDRIIAINGQTIEGTSRREAMDLIKDARGEVQLVLSRAMAAEQGIDCQLSDIPSTSSHNKHRDAQNSGSAGLSSRSSELIVRASSRDRERSSDFSKGMHSSLMSDEWLVDSTSSRTSPGELSEQHDVGISSDDGEPQVKVTRQMPSSPTVGYHVSPVRQDMAEDSFSVGSASAFQKPTPKKRVSEALPQADKNSLSPRNLPDKVTESDQPAVGQRSTVTKFSDPQYTAKETGTPEMQASLTRQDTDERQPSERSKDGTKQMAAAKQESSTGSMASGANKSVSHGSRSMDDKNGMSDEASSDEEVSVVMTGPAAKSRKKATESDAVTGLSNKATIVAASTAVGSPTSVSAASLATRTSDKLNVGDKYEVLLAKTSGSLGLNVTGGTNTSVKHGGIYVKSLVPGGPAELCTQICLGDRVLSVNGIDLTAVTHRLAVETLRNAEAPVSIVLERGEPPAAAARPPADSHTAGLQTPSSPDTRPSSEGASLNQPTISPISTSESMSEVRSEGIVTPLASSTPTVSNHSLFDGGIHFEVLLKKESSGFGFSILGGRTAGLTDPKKSLLRVKKIFPLGAAAKEGNLQVGDIIMNVNSRSLEGFTHADAVHLLRSCTQEVKLSVCRVDARVLSPLTESVVNAPSRNSSTVSPALWSESPKLTLAQRDVDVEDSNSLSTADQSTSSIESEITVVTPGAGQHRQEQSAVSQPTPIRELDDILQTNTTATSMHTSGSETPLRASSQRSSGRQTVSMQRKTSASSTLPSSLADRLRMALSNSGASSRRSSVSDGQGADRRAEATLVSESETSHRDGTGGDASQLPSVIDVTLRKNGNGSLGFSVMGGIDGGCFVKAILQDPALADGRLRAGDRLLKANGKDMTIMTAAAAVQYLRQAPETVSIRIQRSTPDDVNPSGNPSLATKAGELPLADTSSGLSNMLGDNMKAPAIGYPSAISQVAPDSMIRSSSSNSSSSNGGREPENLDSISLSSSSSERSLGDGCEDFALDAGLLPLDFAKQAPGAQMLATGSRSVMQGLADEAAQWPSAPPSSAAAADDEGTRASASGDTAAALAGLLELLHPTEDEDCLMAPTVEGSAHAAKVVSSSVAAAAADSALPRQMEQVAEQEQVEKEKEKEEYDGGRLEQEEQQRWRQPDPQQHDERERQQMSVQLEVSSVLPPMSHDTRPSTEEASLRSAALRSAGDVADEDPDVGVAAAAAIARRESIRLLPTEDVIRVSLTKPPGGGLGFSINCEEQDGHLYAFVKAITAGGVAEADGRLHAGDRLLKVNDVNIAGYTQPKAVALIRQLQGIVQLVLARQQSRYASPAVEPSPDMSEQSSSSEEDVSVLLASSLRSATDGESTDVAKEINDSGRVLLSTLSSGTDGKEGLNVLLREDTEVKGATLSSDSSDDHSPASDLDFDLPDDSNTSNTGRASASIVDAMSHGRTSQTRLDVGSLSSTAKGARSGSQESTEDAHDSDGSLSEILRKRFSPASGAGAQSPLVPLSSLTLSISDDVSEGDELSDAHEPRKPANPTRGSQMRRSNRGSPWYGGESVGVPLFGRHVVAEWVGSLPLVKVGAKGLYVGGMLERMLAQLRIKIANDDPSEEFKAMKNIKPTDDCHEGKAPQNKSLNRFRNVLPYDYNRVILSGDDDYINASHIRIPLGEDMSHYIACQGPLPQTTPHFWQMVVEQKVQVVAMLTLDVESGKVKCHRYWPDSPDTPLVVSDRYQVSLNKAYQMEHFDVRYITVSDQFSSLVHQTVHLNYKTWPDRGVPSEARSLLQFLRVMHEFHVSGPVVLHCSAGIGRTGAVIALDIIMSCMEKDLKFDINQIIIDLRKQRQGMIQTKDQYLFCYDASIQAMEYVK